MEPVTMIPLQGLAGPIKVKNQDWNMNMAAMGAALPDYDLAAVMTYIRKSWGNTASEVTADDVKAIRAGMKPGASQIKGEQLLEMPE